MDNFKSDFSQLVWKNIKNNGSTNLISLLLRLEHPELYPELNIEDEREM